MNAASVSTNGFARFGLSRIQRTGLVRASWVVALAVTQKTAWFMNHRIRLAMDSGSYEKLDGVIEIDETYVGGLAKNMHRKVRTQKITGTGGVDKVAIQGAKSRGGELRAAVIDGTSAPTLQSNIYKWVTPGATVYTDEARGYRGLDGSFAHKTVNHSFEYVSGDVHINGTENFWALFLEVPLLSRFECDFSVYQDDACQVAQRVGSVDLAYLDPPYNQHPYGSNYFMLNLLVDYAEPAEVSKVSGIPKDWTRSAYNVRSRAAESLKSLIANLDATFVLISYNDEGFIAPEEMRDLLLSFGIVQEITTQYNTFRGSRNLRARDIHVTEHLFILERA